MAQSLNILLVDDEPGVLFALKMLFSLLPASVTTAGSAKEGLDLYSPERFDAVVSDLRMPDINGIEFFQQLKSRFPQITFLLISGHADKSEQARALDLGVSAFVSKPFTIADIKIALKIS